MRRRRAQPDLLGAAGPAALEVFLHEYRIRFPVGIDRPTATGTPATMTAFAVSLAYVHGSEDPDGSANGAQGLNEQDTFEQ